MLYFSVPLDAGDIILAQVTASGGVAMGPVGWTPKPEVRSPFGVLSLRRVATRVAAC